MHITRINLINCIFDLQLILKFYILNLECKVKVIKNEVIKSPLIINI